MKRINVIDLDGTLIKYDTLRKYYFLLIKKSKYKLKILIFGLFRFLKFENNYNFLAKIYRYTEKLNKKDKVLRSFIDKIYTDIDRDLIEQVYRNTKNDDINILCTASPDFYVKPLAIKLGWECICSSYFRGKLIRMFGDEKIKYLTRYYPVEEFFYNFAISDNESDITLIKLFNKNRFLN